ncbi:SRPBCC family protein [Lysobacter koreensis]|uniref:SRPBCC family protein n=1 Tax=Lysobacter koreensis TaxID=266122 RepID=A0ABW2YIS7_9GAMM
MNDFGVITQPGTLRLERVLPGPIERVWAYLTDSDKRGTWLASGEMELHVGGKVEHVFRNADLTAPDDLPPPKYAQHAHESRMHGRVTACEPPRLLSYTWFEGNGEDSEVSFELSAHDGGNVLLVLTHRRLASRDELLSVAAGWHAHVGILIDRLSGRQPQPFWSTHTRLEAEYARRIPADPQA